MNNKEALIIEDNPPNVQVLDMLLKSQGYETTVKSSLAELEKVLISGKIFDLIFLDVELPDGDAIDWMLENKNKINSPEQSQIVGYSVHISEMPRAKEAGFDSFLGKPIDSAEFPNLLEKILSGEKIWSSGA